MSDGGLTWSGGCLAFAAVALAGGCGESASGGERGTLRVVSVFGGPGLGPGQYFYPRAIDTDGEALWVIDKAARVQRIDPASGACLAQWRMPEFELGKPTGVTIAPGDDGTPLVYIPDTHYARVMVYRPPTSAGGAPELVGRFGGYGTGPGQFIYPTDVAVLEAAPGEAHRVERIYVSEYGDNDRISVFDRDFGFLYAFGSFGDGSDPARVEFNRPQSIAIDRERRELVVVDACNHRIGRLTLDGELVRWIGGPDRAGGGPDQLCYPYGLSLRGDGTALVSEFGSHRVHHLDLETGETLGVYGAPGADPGELDSPWGVAELDGRVFVLDSRNCRIQAIRAPGPVSGRRAAR